MGWFTDDANHFGEDDLSEMLGRYPAHLREIPASLPPGFAALATEPRLNLHDVVIQSVDVDDEAERITMLVAAGDLQVGYRDVTLRFGGATLVPDNLQLLAYALGARYATDHWGEATTVIRLRRLMFYPGTASSFDYGSGPSTSSPSS